MLMMRRAIACGFLLFSPCVYGQSGPLERRASSFNSKGVGLTETLLKFSHEEIFQSPSNTLTKHRWTSPLMSVCKTKRFGKHLIPSCSMATAIGGSYEMEL